MKRSDLKAGVLYAVKHGWQPALLLSTDVYEELFRTRGGVSYSPAPDHKPGKDPSKAWGFDRRNYGFLAAEGPRAELKSIDVAAYLAAIVGGDRDYCDRYEHTRLRLITALGQIEGCFDEVQAEKDAFETSRKQREAESRERYNAVVDRLNVVLGDKPLERVERWGGPHEVTLTLAQARVIADALAAKEA